MKPVNPDSKKTRRIPASIRSTGQILNGSNHILHSLYAQSQELVSFESIVRSLGGHKIRLSALKNNELTLTTPSSAQATKLRYRQRNIITALRQAGMDVNSVKIKVSPEFETKKEVQVERHLSPENAAQLLLTADFVDYEPLQNALKRLAERGSNKD